MATSVQGPDEAHFAVCRGLVSAPALSPLGLMIGVCVWRWSPCPLHPFSLPLHAIE